MAKNAKTAAAEEKNEQDLTPKLLTDIIADASRQRKRASELSGQHGKIVQSACERYGLSKEAFTFTRKLYEMEEKKRAGVIRGCEKLWDMLGFFDQDDMFDKGRLGSGGKKANGNGTGKKTKTTKAMPAQADAFKSALTKGATKNGHAAHH